MATFAPEIQPTEAPMFLNLPKGITQPKPNEAGALALKGAGNILDEAATFGHEEVQEAVTKESRDAAEGLQKQYSDSLVADDSSNSKATAYAEMPGNLQSSLQEAPSIEARRANGKITNTQYLAQMNQLQSQLRSKYPDFIPQIDSSFSKVTGEPPANALLKSRIADINATTAALKGEQDKFLTHAYTVAANGFTNVPQLIDDVQNGRKTVQQGWAELSRTMQFKAQKELGDAQFTSYEHNKTYATDIAFNNMTAIAQGHANLAFNAMANGVGTGSPQEILESLGKFQASGKEMTSEEATKKAMDVEAYKTRTAAAIWKDFNKPLSNGKSYIQSLGPDGVTKAKKMVEDIMYPFDALRDSLRKGDVSQAMASANLVKAMTDDTNKAMFDDPNVGNYLRKMAALNLTDPAMSNAIFQNNVTNKFPEAVAAWRQSAATRAATTPGVSLKGDITKAQENGALKGGEGFNDPRLFESLVNDVDRIGDPNTSSETRQKLIQHAYGPANLGVVAKFTKEGYDPATRQIIPNQQFSVFRKMMSDKNLDAAFKEGGESWKTVREFGRQEFGRELFGNAIGRLRSLYNPSVGGNDAVGWDNSQSHFIAVNPSPFVKRVVEDINGGIDVIKKIAEKEGSDPNAYILNQLLEIKAIDPDRMKGLPQAMYDAVNASRESNIKAQEERTKQLREDSQVAPAPKRSKPRAKGPTNERFNQQIQEGVDANKDQLRVRD